MMIYEQNRKTLQQLATAAAISLTQMLSLVFDAVFRSYRMLSLMHFTDDLESFEAVVRLVARAATKIAERNVHAHLGVRFLVRHG